MTIFDLLFPRKCLGCGKIGGYFCSDCLNLVSLDPERICPVCERPSIGGQTHPGCQTSTTLDGLTSIFAYKGIIKKGIGKLKYRFVSDLASDLVEIFLASCGEDKTFSDFCLEKHPCLVPIPLHPKREKWRGFSQTKLLGKLISGNLGLPFLPDLLQRTKNTRPQVELKGKERQKNVDGVFRVNLCAIQEDIRGFARGRVSHNQCQSKPIVVVPSNVLLFDDVWTTGATLKEAARILKRAGVKIVWGLTLAR